MNEEQTISMQLVIQVITLISVGVTIGVSMGGLFWLKELVKELRQDYKTLVVELAEVKAQLAVLQVTRGVRR